MLTPRRIAFINEKGGSAKTTLVANLAAYLALQRGRRVLAIDMDPQGQLGKVLGLDIHRSRRSAIDLLLDSVLGDAGLDRTREAAAESQPASLLPISRTRIPLLDVVVANKSLALFPSWDGSEEADPTKRLARTLDAAPEIAGYDFVFFDGCAELLRTVTTVRTRYGNPDLRITMVVPTFYRRTKLAHEILEKLKQRFPKEIAHTLVGYHVRIDEAQSRGLSIFEHAPADRGAKVMAELAEELELRGAVVEPANAP